MTPHRAAAIAALSLLAATPGMAETVTLTARDGSFSVDGDYLGFDGEFFRIEAAAGRLTLDAARVVCDGAACPDTENFVPDLRISAAPSAADVLLPALIEAYSVRRGLTLLRERDGGQVVYALTPDEGARPVLRLRVTGAEADEALADLLAGAADMAVAEREALPREVALAEEGGRAALDEGRRLRVLALDGIVPLVAVANPVTQIALDDLAAVAAGEVTNWSALGGPDAAIALHLPAEGTGFMQAVDQVLLAPRGLTAADDAQRHATLQDLAQAVSADPNALGVGSYAAQGNAVPLSLSGPCGYVVDASERELKTEDYPLTAPLYGYLPDYRIAAPAREFLAYLVSPAAQPVIARAGLVDQFPRLVPLDDQGRRLANAIDAAGQETRLEDLQQMVRAIAGGDRLTVTFRFRDGSADLDAQSVSNVALLARALERGLFDGRGLTFVGFTDGVGGAAANRDLARERAAAVRDAVRNAARIDEGRVDLSVAAFGEALPMGCDEVPWGRRINRRVEVWLEGGYR